MPDKLDDILKGIQGGQKWITDQRQREILAYELQSAYMFAIMNMRYLKKNQEENQEKTA